MRLVLLPCCGLTLALISPAMAQGKPEKKLPTAPFVHSNCTIVSGECRETRHLSVGDGADFAIEIRKTDLANYDYTVAGIPISTDGDRAEAADLQDTQFVQRHDKRFGGYVVLVRKRLDAGVDATLPNATFTITVTTSKWNLSFAGGFPVSTLVDRKYSLVDSTVGGEAQFLVRRETDRQDIVALSTATFIHISHSSKPLAVSFGLGIGGNTTYFLGPSYLFGDVGAISAGAVFGQRDDLPTGLRENHLTSDANALTSLRKKYAVGAFLALSFNFLGSNRSPFEKPFKGEEEQPQGAASPDKKPE